VAETAQRPSPVKASKRGGASSKKRQRGGRSAGPEIHIFQWETRRLSAGSRAKLSSDPVCPLATPTAAYNGCTSSCRGTGQQHQSPSGGRSGQHSRAQQ